MTFSDWKDDEYQYILNLLASEGNPSVPKNAILSYLEVQISSARIDSQGTIALVLVEVARLAYDLSSQSLAAAKNHMIRMRKKLSQ